MSTVLKNATQRPIIIINMGRCPRKLIGCNIVFVLNSIVHGPSYTQRMKFKEDHMTYKYMIVTIRADQKKLRFRGLYTTKMGWLSTRIEFLNSRRDSLQIKSNTESTEICILKTYL